MLISFVITKCRQTETTPNCASSSQHSSTLALLSPFILLHHVTLSLLIALLSYPSPPLVLHLLVNMHCKHSFTAEWEFDWLKIRHWHFVFFDWKSVPADVIARPVSRRRKIHSTTSKHEADYASITGSWDSRLKTHSETLRLYLQS